MASGTSHAVRGRSLFTTCQKNGSMLTKPCGRIWRTVAAGSGSLARTMVPMRMLARGFIEALSDDDVDTPAGLGAVDRAQGHGEAVDVVAADGFGHGAVAHCGNKVLKHAEMAANAAGYRGARQVRSPHLLEN